MIIALDI